MKIHIEMSAEEKLLVTDEFLTETLKEHMGRGHGISNVSVSINKPNALEVKVVKASNTRPHQVLVNGIDFGDFDELDTGTYSYFPKKQDQLTGEHYICIGKALNKLNKI